MCGVLADDVLEREYARRRQAMVDEVAEMAREIAPSYGGEALPASVLQALSSVPRHRFVPEDECVFAYHNRPLPIGHSQTISQPYIVALMSTLLALDPGDRVLEVGTGSGYQTAVLAEMGAMVYSLEIVEPLAVRAADRLRALGYHQVQVQAGDGQQGWLEQAPFDAIIVTAAAPMVPQPLLDQLKPDGRLVIPLGAAYEVQDLLLIRKDAQGGTYCQHVIPVRFVPLTGG